MEVSEQIHHAFGLMDYCGLTDCYSLVEIRAWSAEETQGAIEARAIELREGRFFSEVEQQLWGTPQKLVERLESAANNRLPAPVYYHIRDEWDGARSRVEYEYRVPQVTALNDAL
jgi:hypothetical protein